MGYSPQMFAEIGGLGLPKNARVMDIGSQDVGLNSPADLRVVNDFICSNGGKPFSEDLALPATLEAMLVFERAGFKYLRSDVDERPGTIYVDLNRLVFPQELRNSIDLVVNVGTTEHLASPVGGFALMHYLAKPGGLMFHDVPVFGYGNHGLTNPTPKFWHTLLWTNSYELVNAAVTRTDETQLDQGNFYHDYLTYMKGLGDMKDISAMMRFVVRKTGDRVFIPPFDAVLPASDGSKEAKLILGSLYPFIMTGVWTPEEVFAGINELLVVIQKPYRIGSLKSELLSPIIIQVIKARSLSQQLKRWLKK